MTPFGLNRGTRLGVGRGHPPRRPEPWRVVSQPGAGCFAAAVTRDDVPRTAAARARTRSTAGATPVGAICSTTSLSRSGLSANPIRPCRSRWRGSVGGGSSRSSPRRSLLASADALHLICPGSASPGRRRPVASGSKIAVGSLHEPPQAVPDPPGRPRPFLATVPRPRLSSRIRPAEPPGRRPPRCLAASRFIDGRRRPGAGKESASPALSDARGATTGSSTTCGRSPISRGSVSTSLTAIIEYPGGPSYDGIRPGPVRIRDRPGELARRDDARPPRTGRTRGRCASESRA